MHFLNSYNITQIFRYLCKKQFENIHYNCIMRKKKPDNSNALSGFF